MEPGVKVFAHWLGQIIGIILLHAIMDSNFSAFFHRVVTECKIPVAAKITNITGNDVPLQRARFEHGVKSLVAVLTSGPIT